MVYSLADCFAESITAFLPMDNGIQILNQVIIWKQDISLISEVLALCKCFLGFVPQEFIASSHAKVYDVEQLRRSRDVFVLVYPIYSY